MLSLLVPRCSKHISLVPDSREKLCPLLSRREGTNGTCPSSFELFVVRQLLLENLQVTEMQKEAQGKKSSQILYYPGATTTVILLVSFSAHSVFTPEPLAQLDFASSAFLELLSQRSVCVTGNLPGVLCVLAHLPSQGLYFCH